MTLQTPSKEAPTGIRPRHLCGLLAGPLLSFLLLLLPAPAGMSQEAWRLVAVAVWMVTWWLSEAIPIPATALLPILLLPLYGIADIGSVTQNYGHPLIFLFLGGFLLALAMQNVGLHRRVALTIVAAIGGSPRRIVLGFMLATAFLSLWISNTATAIVMFAVAVSVIDIIKRSAPDAEAARRFAVAVLLGVAYSASIGGVGTLIGTPPNALLASFLSSEYGIQIDFLEWMAIGLPVVAVMLPLAWLLLTRALFRTAGAEFGDLAPIVRGELAALGPRSRGETMVAAVFLLAVAGWVLGQPIRSLTGLPISDTAVAMTAALLLFSLPISLKEGRFALDWQLAAKLPWGVLLLFGGGLALAAGFRDSGLAAWIGGEVGHIEVATWVLVLAVTAAMVYMSELSSNTASTATFLPIMAAVAVGLGLDPQLLTIPVAIASSMAFMLPVATPPNAIVFSHEDLRFGDMVHAGLWLNPIAVAVCFLIVYFLVRPVLGL